MTYEVAIDRYARQGWRDEIKDWLEDRGRLGDLEAMGLIGPNPLFPGIVIVLNNRLTAIMLKLEFA